jgi:hypothetical protein
LVRPAEAGLSAALSGPLEIGPTTARLSQHLRFAKLVPKNLRGVFSDTTAGSAAASIRLHLSVLSQGVTLGRGRSVSLD